MKKRIGIVLFLLFFLFSSILFQKHLKAGVSTVLLLAETFPQTKIELLKYISREPREEKVGFMAGERKISGELFRPNDTKTHPAIIIAMGVKPGEENKPTIVNFARTLAKQGFVVLFANSQDLENDTIVLEDKETFIAGFNYLSNKAFVQKEKISFVGFSVGASIAALAAQDERIAEDIYSIIWFGGYYNAFDYLISLATKTSFINNEEISWPASQEAIGHVQNMLLRLTPEDELSTVKKILVENEKDEGALEQLSPNSRFIVELFSSQNHEKAQRIIENAPQEITKSLQEFSPAQKIHQLKAPLFILHEKSDHFVPFFESQKLRNAIKPLQEKAYLEISLFEHVKPKGGVSLPIFSELFKLFVFVYQVLVYLSP